MERNDLPDGFTIDPHLAPYLNGQIQEPTDVPAYLRDVFRHRHELIDLMCALLAQDRIAEASRISSVVESAKEYGDGAY